MDKIQMVDLVSQYEKIKGEVLEGFHEILENAQFINGPAVQEFSKNLAEYHEVEHVIPCGNGTDALQIALMALDLEEGDEVITTPFTFVATAEVIALLGLKPVFVDVDPDTFNMDVGQIEEKISSRTKCIIPVHLFGQCCDMEKISEIAHNYDISVVEDNAQSIGAYYTFSDGRRKRSGTIGHIGATSFFPSKNLGAYGDGGAITTADDKLAERLFSVCNHGSKVKYFHDNVGVNSRLDTLQAHVLNIKLNHLDDYIAARQSAAKKYDEALEGLNDISVPYRAANSTHVFHQYTLKVDGGKRDGLMKYLQENDIPCAIYYPVPLHIQEAYRYYGYSEGDFPVAETLASQVLSLPMHTELTDEQLKFITDKIHSFFHG